MPRHREKSFTIFFPPQDRETLVGLHLEACRAGVTLQEYALHVLTYAVSAETRAYLATARRAEPANGQRES
jgi:hypothetical protein